MPLKLQERNFGTIPFWFWNGDQEEQEITRQLKLIAAGGCRGAVFHARVGNRTQYMSERWLQLVRHACKEAEKLGLSLWIYDEEGFPSGSVGGRLPEKGEFYRGKILHYSRGTALQACRCEHLLAVFPEDDPTRRADPSALPPETPVLIFQRKLNPAANLPDYLNREVCEEFLRMTHYRYEQAIGDFFGNVVTTLFTDDLNHTLGSGPFLPYTDELPRLFEETYHYSLPDHLVFLVENLPGASRVRLDYRSLVRDVFIRNFVMPMRAWAEKNHLQFTGHLSGDEGPLLLEMNNYSDPMAFYEQESIPGVDDYLTQNQLDAYLSMPVNPMPAGVNEQSGFSIIQLCRKASSVANQFKDGLCCCESLASLGWGCPVHSWLAQLRMELGLGINVIVPHAFFYSTAGLTKRDHPQSFFFQSPYYRVFKEIMGGISRSTQLLSRGRTKADVLVVHPICSVWILTDGEIRCPDYQTVCSSQDDETGTVQGYTDFLSALSLKLMNLHVDFDFSSEDQMARFGVPDGKNYQLGHCSYHTVILPDLINLHPKAAEQLGIFAENGGRVIILGRRPEMIGGGKASAAVLPDAEHLPGVDSLNKEILSPSLHFTAREGGESEILVNTRIVDGRKEYYLCNFSRETKHLSAALEKYDLFLPDDGRIIRNHGTMPETFPLYPGEACHLLPEKTLDVPVEELSRARRDPGRESRKIRLRWSRVIREPNTMAIDYAVSPRGVRFHFDDAGFQKIRPGTWLRIPVDLNFIPENAKLYAEPEIGSDWTLNGNPLSFADGEMHRASADLRGIDIRSLLHTGRNELCFRTQAGRMETIYLEGDFSVSLSGEHAEIIPPSRGLFEELSRNGYPFYWGTVDYTAEIEWEAEPGKDLFLHVPAAEGVLALEINGRGPFVHTAAPCDFSCTNLLQKGHSRITLSLMNTPQNFFGPHRVSSYIRPYISMVNSAWRPPPVNGNAEWGYALCESGILEEPYLLVCS